MLSNFREEPKLYRLYVALYDLGSVYHWAFVVRGSNGALLLDATVGYVKHQYRKRNWDKDLSKGTIALLCDVMDLNDDDGVERLLKIAESTPLPGEEDKNFCRTWAECVLRVASENVGVLRAPIDRIRDTIIQEALGNANKRFGDPYKIIEPF